MCHERAAAGRTGAGVPGCAGREPEPPYERPPLSKEYLARNKSFERILIRPPSFWGERGVTLRPATVVTGVDLSPEMINIALDRAREADAPPTVTSILGDVLTYPFERPFDVVWSRDALMHLHDKPALFARLFELTAPGGRLVITDYAKGVGERSPEFRNYIEATGYHVVDPAS